MRKLIIAGIAFVLLFGGFIVYIEIDKRKFIDNISSVSPVVDQPVNVLETTREVTQANEEPKFQEVDPAELIAAVNQIPEQFGYSEASTTYAKLETKRMSGEKLTIDERVARLEAMLYLYPNEGTRGSLILQKWLQSKGPSYDYSFSDQDIVELKELGIPVAYSGNSLMINSPPDVVIRQLTEESPEEYRHLWRDFLSHGEPIDPVSDTVFSEGIGEEIDFLPARSEQIPIPPESQVLGTPEHVHQEEGHIHEPLTIQSPRPTDAKSVEADGWEGLLPEQREQAKQLIDQYGSEEGLRRLREMAPEAARRFERGHPPQSPREQGEGSRTVPDGEQSESGSKN